MQSRSSAKERTVRYIDSLTPLRGIAALWVVVFHFDEISGFLVQSHLFSRESSMLIGKGYLWVDFFFLLSGFIITHVYADRFSGRFGWRPAKKYLVARFSRLYPLHVFTLGTHVLFLIMLILWRPGMAEALREGFYSWGALGVNLIMGHAMGLSSSLTWNVPSWSIAAEWWTYILALAIFPLVNLKGRLRSAIAVAVSLAGLVAITLLHPKGNLDVTYDVGVLRCLFEFTIGIGMYQLFRDGTWRGLFSSNITFMASAVVILVLLHLGRNDLLILPAFAVLILSAAHNQGAAARVLNRRPLRFLGDVSYSVYMMQGIWLMFMWTGLDVWIKTLGNAPVGPVARVVVLISLLTATVLSAAFTYRYVEIPAREWLRRRLTPVARIEVPLTAESEAVPVVETAARAGSD